MEQTEKKPVIFISHQSKDADVATMILDFLVGIGVPNDFIFCSSLPGNDVGERISSEIKQKLKDSILNIAILSKNYFDSPYCLNEEGILWFCNKPLILFALPEITFKDLIGFWNADNKLRRLDDSSDISYLYDVVEGIIHLSSKPSQQVINRKTRELNQTYQVYLKNRKTNEANLTNDSISEPPVLKVTTDDERIVLYYMFTKEVKSASVSNIDVWLTKNEIFDVNIDNAFQLLESSNYGEISVEGDFDLNIEIFRKYTSGDKEWLTGYKNYVDKHHQPRDELFYKLWKSNDMDQFVLLFLCYIVDERDSVFGSRSYDTWQIDKIKKWKKQYCLDSVLSSNYQKALNYFVDNKFVYVTEVTSYGNPRQYELYPSLKDLLFDCPEDIKTELQKERNKVFSF